MNVKILDIKGTWREVADAARTTISLPPGDKEISSEYKRRMLLCEHSPIRKLAVNWIWEGLKSWISVHFVRHKYGIEHWVSTQRDDRTQIDRNASRQDTPVIHEAMASAQAIINISRKRLCMQAHRETRYAWIDFLDRLYIHEPELVDSCVCDCVYRGHCFEYKSCGWHKTDAFKREVNRYRRGINE